MSPSLSPSLSLQEVEPSTRCCANNSLAIFPKLGTLTLEAKYYTDKPSCISGAKRPNILEPIIVEVSLAVSIELSTTANIFVSLCLAMTNLLPWQDPRVLNRVQYLSHYLQDVFQDSALVFSNGVLCLFVLRRAIAQPFTPPIKSHQPHELFDIFLCLEKPYSVPT